MQFNMQIRQNYPRLNNAHRLYRPHEQMPPLSCDPGLSIFEIAISGAHAQRWLAWQPCTLCDKPYVTGRCRGLTCVTMTDDMNLSFQYNVLLNQQKQADGSYGKLFASYSLKACRQILFIIWVGTWFALTTMWSLAIVYVIRYGH